jgi:hypothetical protein
LSPKSAGVRSDFDANNNKNKNKNNNCHTVKRMSKQKRQMMPGCQQDEEVAKLQKDLKRARQFNTDSHSKIVYLEAQLKAQLEKEKNKDRGMEQLINEVLQLRQQLCLHRDDGTKEERQELRKCLQQAFSFMNAVLDGESAAEHASEDLLLQGADAIVHYLELVRRHEGTDSLLEELRKALPLKNPASSQSRAVSGKIRSAILQYHPDKHAGAGRWVRALCERVTKLLNALK